MAEKLTHEIAGHILSTSELGTDPPFHDFEWMGLSQPTVWRNGTVPGAPFGENGGQSPTYLEADPQLTRELTVSLVNTASARIFSRRLDPVNPKNL